MLLSAAALALMAGSAGAAVTEYTNQGAFTAAAGALSSEDFNSFVSEVSFRTAPVVAGSLTLQGFGDQSDRNYIDIPPHQFAVFNIDGTTNVNAFVTTTAGFTISFDHPVTAFGATFASMQDEVTRTQITVLGTVLTPPTRGLNDIVFYGFISDTAFSSITFNGVNNDGFSFDNALFSAGGVPEPATWALMIGGFGLAGVALRRRRTVTA